MVFEGTTAQTVSRTVLVLAQIRGYDTKQALATAMGWHRSKLSRTLSGDHEWTIAGLEDAAKALGLSGPGDLFRPLAELVGAVSPPTEGITSGLTQWVDQATSSLSEASAQVIPFPRVYQPVSGARATALAPVTRLGASHGGRRANSA